MAENVLEVLKALRASNPLDGNDVEVVAEATGIHYACDRLEPLIEELIAKNKTLTDEIMFLRVRIDHP